MSKSTPAPSISRNVAGLVLGFGLGQGSMFVAQTVLLLASDAQMVGALGVGITFVTLAYHVTDFGTTVTLARHSASGVERRTIDASIAVRVVVALVVIAASALAGWLVKADSPYIAGMLFTGCLGIAPWALNVTGVLDGTGRSGLSGVLASLPWIMASTAAVATMNVASILGGGAVGFAFSVGSIAVVVLQWRTLPREIRAARWSKPTRESRVGIFGESGAYFLGWVPGQLLSRVQLLIVGGVLGLELAGIFVYVKQILNAASQFVQFIRRAEFSRLIPLSAAAVGHIRRTIALQRRSLAGSLVATIAILLAALVFRQWSDVRFSSVAGLALMLLITVPVGALAAAFGQVFVAAGKASTYSFIIYLSLVVGFTTLIATISKVGLLSVLWAELAMYIMQLVLFQWIGRRHALEVSMPRVP